MYFFHFIDHLILIKFQFVKMSFCLFIGLRIDHPEGIEAVPLDRLNYNWLARIHGPPQSVYQGGVFYLNLKVPHE